MAQGSPVRLVGLGRNDPMFARVRIEAEEPRGAIPPLPRSS